MNDLRKLSVHVGAFEFPSATEAAQYFGITTDTFHRALNSDNPIWYVGMALLRRAKDANDQISALTYAMEYLQVQTRYLEITIGEEELVPQFFEWFATQGRSDVPRTSDDHEEHASSPECLSGV